eukprot:CAMPEP_0176439150 /NCGR_PEP_ID=MMETSP0127-20121128/19761_1 /TAXON_ID=938130 /ORGANISM="Platyophrya macrostoma, Strain WH" /LENGTH=175 /DNA_ID=CAMNT_0017823343 /DNA_START=155 /DNA_END=678 /DNA_ORIENTATION=+
MANVVLGARLLALGAIPAVAQFQSGVLLYWIGMSLVGLGQPLLVRLGAFRRWFGIPEPVKNDEELIQRRFVVQAPTLSYLFEAEKISHPQSDSQQQASTSSSSSSPSSFTSSSTLYNVRKSRTLSEEMQQVEATHFKKLQQKSVLADGNGNPIREGKGAAFARSGWRSKDAAPPV